MISVSKRNPDQSEAKVISLSLKGTPIRSNAEAEHDLK